MMQELIYCLLWLEEMLCCVVTVEHPPFGLLASSAHQQIMEGNCLPLSLAFFENYFKLL